MHDTDMDRDLIRMIEEMTSADPEAYRILKAGADRIGVDLPEPKPGTDLVPYEPAGEVATVQTEGGYADSASSAIFHFDAVVELELGKIVSARRKHEEMRKEKPLTFQTPEYKVEVENASIDSVLVLADAVEALERAVR